MINKNLIEYISYHIVLLLVHSMERRHKELKYNKGVNLNPDKHKDKILNFFCGIFQINS